MAGLGKIGWAAIVAGALALGALLGVGVYALIDQDDPAPAAAERFTLSGSIVLPEGGAALDIAPSGDYVCHGDGGYDDIAEGTQVTVYDPAGAVIAAGALGAGGDTTEPCVLPIVVPNVPAGHDMYQVEVAQRGKVAVPSQEARAGEVRVQLG